MPKSEQDLERAAQRGAVSYIAQEAKKSNLPWGFFKNLLVKAIGIQAELVERQVAGDDNNQTKQKLEKLSLNLTFGKNVKSAIDEFLGE